MGLIRLIALLAPLTPAQYSISSVSLVTGTVEATRSVGTSGISIAVISSSRTLITI